MASKDKVAEIDVQKNSIELSLPLTSQVNSGAKKESIVKTLETASLPNQAKLPATLIWNGKSVMTRL